MKRRLILLLAVLSLLTAISPKQTYAFSQTSEQSADFAGSQLTSLPTIEQDNRAQILQSYLEQYNSPLADHAETLINEADANGLDWKMVAAIAGVESNFGEAIPPYSYNAWGYNVYGNNVRSFSSWDDGITVVSTALRQDYINGRGETTIYEIGSSYAADSDWAYKVQNYMNAINQYSQRFNKPNLSISL